MKPERSKNVLSKCVNKKEKDRVNEVSAVSEEAIEDTINSVFKNLDISAVQDDILPMKKTKKSRKVRQIPDVARYFEKITKDNLETNDALPVGGVNKKVLESLDQLTESKTLTEMEKMVNRFDENQYDPESFIIFKCIMKLGRPHVKCKFAEKGIEFSCLIDTGCWRSLMNQLAYKHLLEKMGPEAVKLESTDVRLASHSGQSIGIIGSLKWPVWILNKQSQWIKIKEVNWLVTSDEKTMILGGSFLRSRSIMVQYHEGELVGKRVAPAGVTMYIPKGKEDLEEGPLLNWPVPGKFTLQPMSSVTILPEQTLPVTCRVIGESPEDDRILGGKPVDINYDMGLPEEGVDFVSIVEEDMTISIPFKNPKNHPAFELSPEMTIGHGQRFGVTEEFISSRIDEVVNIMSDIQSVEVEKYKICICELNSDICTNKIHPNCGQGGHQDWTSEKNRIPVHIANKEGNTKFPFFGLTESYGVSDPLDDYIVRGAKDSNKHVFLRAGLTTMETAFNIVDKFKNDSIVHFLVAVPEHDPLTTIEWQAVFCLKAACEEFGFTLRLGIFMEGKDFTPCRKHRPFNLQKRPKTILHFSQMQRPTAETPFGRNFGLRSLASIPMPRISVRSNTTKKTNLVWCKIDNVTTNPRMARVAVRHVVHALYLNNRRTQLSITVDSAASAFAIRDALIQELRYSKLRLRSYVSMMDSLFEEGIWLGKGAECIVGEEVEMNSVMEMFDETECEFESIANINATIAASIRASEGIAEPPKAEPDEPFKYDPLPNPETAKGLAKCIELGNKWKPTESFCEMVDNQKDDDGAKDFPEMAMDTKSVDSDKSEMAQGGNIPLHGPNYVDPERAKSWRDLPNWPFEEKQYSDFELIDFYFALLDLYNEVVQKGKGHLKAIKCIPLDAILTKSHHIRKPYPMNKQEEEILLFMLNKMAREGFLERIPTSAYTSPCFLVYRGSSQKLMTQEERRKALEEDPCSFYRIVVDLSGINKLVEPTSNEMISAEQVIDKLQGGQVFSIIDLAELFHNIPLTKKLSEALALIAPGPVIYKPLFGIEGYKGLPMFANQVVQSLLQRSRNHTVSFLDDICVFGKDKYDLRLGMTYLFQDLEEGNAMVNLAKMKLERTEFTYLGFYFEVVEGRLTYIPTTQRYEIFKEIKITDVASVMKFLGMVAFCSAFINSLASLCQPLYNILSENSGKPKTTKVFLSKLQEEVFRIIKARVMNMERLVVPGVHTYLRLYVDAGDKTYGSILTIVINGQEFIAAFHSKSFSKAFWRSNSSLSKEAFACMKEVIRHRYRIWGAERIEVITDCRALAFLASRGQPETSVIPQRWLMVLSAFFHIVYKFVKREHLYGPDLLGRFRPADGEREYFYINEDPERLNDLNYYKKLPLCHYKNDLLQEYQEYTMADLVTIGLTNKQEINEHSVCSECQVCKVDGYGQEQVDANGDIISSIFDEDFEAEYYADEPKEVEEIISQLQDIKRSFPSCTNPEELEEVAAVTEELTRVTEPDMDPDDGQRHLREHSRSLGRMRSANPELQEEVEQFFPRRVGHQYTGQVIYQAQQDDEDISKIIEEITNNAVVDQRYRRYTMMGNLLVRKAQRDSKKKKDLRIVIPRQLMVKMLATGHLFGHPNHVKLCEMFERFFYHQNMIGLARTLVLACKHCIRYKVLTYPNLPQGMLSPPRRPFESLFVDFMDMQFPVWYKGKYYKHVLTIVDHFSFMVFAYATPDMTHETFIDRMKHLVKTLDVPGFTIGQIVTDNQSSLIPNAEVRRYLDGQGIKYRTTFPYVSKNNLAEIGNRLVRSVLRTLHKSDIQSWPKRLKPAIRIINSTPHVWRNDRLKGVSPIELVTGQAPINSPFSGLHRQPPEVKRYFAKLKRRIMEKRFKISQAYINERKEHSKIKRGALVVLKIPKPYRKKKYWPYYLEEIWKVREVRGHKIELEKRDNPNERVIKHINWVKAAGILPRDVYEKLTRDQRSHFQFIGSSTGVGSNSSYQSSKSPQERFDLFSGAVREASQLYPGKKKTEEEREQDLESLHPSSRRMDSQDLESLLSAARRMATTPPVRPPRKIDKVPSDQASQISQDTLTAQSPQSPLPPSDNQSSWLQRVKDWNIFSRKSVSTKKSGSTRTKVSSKRGEPEKTKSQASTVKNTSVPEDSTTASSVWSVAPTVSDFKIASEDPDSIVNSSVIAPSAAVGSASSESAQIAPPGPRGRRQALLRAMGRNYLDVHRRGFDYADERANKRKKR